ncbi:MAG: hypothetical protein C7B45_17330 [Sulfobacillus acidophilus]|uniref:Transposase IS204/IS1001/IS1096/IS1165 zinc-finger domain-containing protein n=1 Tax=Sulfobacillus acidophilus TaxID=53633 RepID=A0A2T2WCK2_9FIRM|nr:MAG: hypothetical protein C7B45_17330 [Sulfobacillus acidophilus]
MDDRIAVPVPNLLNLPDYRIITVDETDDAYHIAAETLVDPTMCSHCESAAIVGYGRREQWTRDLPMHGKRVGLYSKRAVFAVKRVGRPFTRICPA